MINEIMKLVQQYGQSAVVDNPQVPNEHNEAVLKEANHSITSELQQLVSTGDMSKVSEMLSSGGVANNVSGNFASNIAQKFGIDVASAKNVAGSLIPGILGELGSKAQSGNLDLKGMLGSLGSKMGLDKDGDGDVDLGDITKMFGK